MVHLDEPLAGHRGGEQRKAFNTPREAAIAGEFDTSLGDPGTREQFGRGSLLGGGFFRGPLVATGERGGVVKQRTVVPGLLNPDVDASLAGPTQTTTFDVFKERLEGDPNEAGRTAGAGQFLPIELRQQFDRTPGGGFADEAGKAAREFTSNVDIDLPEPPDFTKLGLIVGAFILAAVGLNAFARGAGRGVAS